MIRTQVYIPDDLHRDLMLLVKQEGINFSGLIREGAAEIVKKKKKAKTGDWKEFAGAAGKSKIKTNAVKDIHDYYANFGNRRRGLEDFQSSNKERHFVRGLY